MSPSATPADLGIGPRMVWPVWLVIFLPFKSGWRMFLRTYLMYIFLNFFNESSPPFLGWFLKKKKTQETFTEVAISQMPTTLSSLKAMVQAQSFHGKAWEPMIWKAKICIQTTPIVL